MTKRLLQLAGHLESAVLSLFAVSATLIMSSNAASRYLLRTTFYWAEESIRLIFVWSMFFAITTAFVRNQHIGFSALVERHPVLQEASRLLYAVTLGVVGAIVTYYGYRYMTLTGSVRLAGTELPSGLLLLPGVISGAVWAVLGAVRTVLVLRDLVMRRGAER